MIEMLMGFVGELTLYVTASLLVATTLWALIELTSQRRYRTVLWGVIPAILVAFILMAVSVTTLKGRPSSELPSKEWILINHIPVKDVAIYMWILVEGSKEPLSVKIPYTKEKEDELKQAGDKAKLKGRPLKGKFVKPFGHDKSKDLRLWEFDVESTLPPKNSGARK